MFKTSQKKYRTMNVSNECHSQNSDMSGEENGDFREAIQKAICDNNVESISGYLQSGPCGSHLVNVTVIQELEFLLQAECNSSEYTVRTKCVLLVLEHIKTVSCESERWDAIARELVKLCALCLMNGILVYKIEENREELLMKIIHAVSDLMYVSPKVSTGIAQVLSAALLSAVVREEFSFAVRRNILSTLACMVTMSTVQDRNSVLRNHKSDLLKLSDFMVTCGDCELQSTIMEVILQLLFADSQQNSISESLFPSYPAVQDAFKLFTFENVRSELRQFLNKVNSLLEKKLVYTVPCVAALLDNKELRKPDEYTEFWVDFSISSAYLYINHQGETATPCNLTRISEKDVKQIVATQCCYTLSSETVQCVRLDIYIDNNEVLKIYFPKSESYCLLQKDVLIPLFGKKYQDGSMVDECNSPYVKTNIIVLNDSPDEIVSSPQQTPSIRKDKTKLIKSIYKNHNKSKRLISNNNRSRILESENANNLIVPESDLIRRKNFFKGILCIDKGDDNKCNNNNNSNNNVNSVGDEKIKKGKRNSELLDVERTSFPLLDIKKRTPTPNKVTFNGKFRPTKSYVNNNKESEPSKAENKEATPQNSLQKRKLYSFQNEDYMFSSAEQYSASLPKHYKTNGGKNSLNSKVTYSYRAHRSAENKMQELDTIFSDTLENKYQRYSSLVDVPQHFPMKVDVHKSNKLQKQHMPMEVADDSDDESTIFKINRFGGANKFCKQAPAKRAKQSQNKKTAYSDLSSSESGNIHVNMPINTYSRKPRVKRKKTKPQNKKTVHIDSDTDTDYKPSTSHPNVKPAQRFTRQRHRESSIIALVDRIHEDDRLRDCNEAECCEELQMPSCLNPTDKTDTPNKVQSARMPLLPEVAKNAEYDFGDDETIILKYTPLQTSGDSQKLKVPDDRPIKKRKYVQVKISKISTIEKEKISKESNALASPRKVNNTCRQKKRINDEVKNKEHSRESNQHKNTAKQTSSVIDRNTLFDDLTAYCEEELHPDSSRCIQNDIDVHEKSDIDEMNNSQSSVRSSSRIKDLSQKDNLCMFGRALTHRMKEKLINIQDECKVERKQQYSELDSVLINEEKNINKQKKQILSVAKEMETCRKILEGAFSTQMQSCQELQRSIDNINSAKKHFFKETEKIEVKQSSRIIENMKAIKEKMSSIVSSFIAADKKAIA